MDEVTKLYENAGVKKGIIPCPANYYGYDCTGNNRDDKDCSCATEGYPLFTAEKQLELIKWLIQKNFYDERIIRSNYEKTYFYCSYLYDYCESEYFEKFEEALANVINYFWQDLTEEERKQIKEILE